MNSLQGFVSDITFQNEDTGYTVLRLQTKESVSLVTCVGVMPTIGKGESVLLHGEWQVHPRFGRQFNAERYEIVRPTTKEGVLHLLSSGLISSIGPVRAKLIVDRFGAEALNVLDREPERLAEVHGIGPKTLEKIKEAWTRQRHIRDLMLFLQEIGVTVNLAMRIYKAYGSQAREKISADPYALLEDVWGVGFVKADRIAQKMGFAHDSYKRIRAGLRYGLEGAASRDGHCYLPRAELVKRSAELLGVTEEVVVYTLDHTVDAHIFTSEGDRIYLPAFLHAEKKIAELLHTRLARQLGAPERSGNELRAWLGGWESRTGMHPDPTQAEAIFGAILNPMFLLTGGPGTGKTSILQVIVSFFRERKKAVVLAAPTGRAAQRMGTVAGLQARTIHRLLEFKGVTNSNNFQRNESNPIEADVLIVDEMSMVDLMLMRNLIAALPPTASLIMVGDNNQLPSVGPGNVLADLIASRRIPHVHLTTIFRQAASSRIVTAAHEIMNGTVPSFANAQNDNCFFIARESPEECLDNIVDLVSKRLPSRYGFDPITDIQVLSPMHKGPLGTLNITAVLQRKLATSDKKIARGSMDIYLGDKVLQTRNNYDLGVFNGDIGIVTDIGEDEVTVSFDGTIVRYEQKELEELIPAYCMSIHKSQGCEFKAVVIPLVTQHYILLQRNLLYTALTRARQLCIFVGTRKALALAVRNNQAILRYSGLADRLRETPVA